jgi:hypothetical protein
MKDLRRPRSPVIWVACSAYSARLVEPPYAPAPQQAVTSGATPVLGPWSRGLLLRASLGRIALSSLWLVEGLRSARAVASPLFSLCPAGNLRSPGFPTGASFP